MPHNGVTGHVSCSSNSAVTFSIAVSVAVSDRQLLRTSSCLGQLRQPTVVWVGPSHIRKSFSRTENKKKQGVQPKPGDEGSWVIAFVLPLGVGVYVSLQPDTEVGADIFVILFSSTAFHCECTADQPGSSFLEQQPHTCSSVAAALRVGSRWKCGDAFSFLS